MEQKNNIMAILVVVLIGLVAGLGLVIGIGNSVGVALSPLNAKLAVIEKIDRRLGPLRIGAERLGEPAGQGLLAGGERRLPGGQAAA